MSEITAPALESTDLTVSSVPAQNANTPGDAAPNAAADRPAEQTDPTQDLSGSLPAPENTPFQPAQYEAFGQLANELKLSPEQVEKLLAFHAQYATHYAQQLQEEKRGQVTAWANQTRAMYGANLAQEITFALRAADTFGGPELRALLEETGLGNHPVMIRTLSGIGRTISEDASTGGVPSAPQDKTFAEALYGRKN